MSAVERVERDRDLERLLTFVDAVAAVAITLLILPLVDLAGELHHGESVGRLIRSHSGQFWGAALSFTVIARIWLIQHELMRPVISATRGVVAWLLLWVLAVVFLPFPTALLPTAGSQATTKVLYIGTLTISSACISLLAATISRHREIRDRDTATSPLTAVISTVLLVVALVVSLTVPAASYYPLALLATADALASGYRKVRGRANRRNAAGTD